MQYIAATYTNEVPPLWFHCYHYFHWGRGVWFNNSLDLKQSKTTLISDVSGYIKYYDILLFVYDKPIVTSVSRTHLRHQSSE